MKTDSIQAWRIEPMPDFLGDHTLTGEAEPERLREHAARWVQLLGSLWEWRDRASFALRYVSDRGRINVYFVSTSVQPSEAPRLRGEIEVLLRAHRLLNDPIRARVPLAILLQDSDLPKPVLLEVAQYTTRCLWRLPQQMMVNEQLRTRYHWLPQREWDEPLVVYPWWGPGGPFLIPMESLLSQPVKATVSLYLQPTELRPEEWEWLALMSREAQSKGEQNLQQIGSGAAVRTVDPSANLAGRLYMANLRRLSATPFLVAAHCCAAEGRIDVARSLAGALQALVHEPPFERPQQEEQRLPSGAAVRGDAQTRTPAGFTTAALQQYREFQFGPPPSSDPLSRMPFLADAQGAATLFRLPVSVRGGVPGMRVKQLPPDFHPGPRETTRPDGHLQLGCYHGGGGAYMPVRDLTKHALITGFTGSGKTVTVMQLLHQLWIDHNVPFLAIESAKQEYRGLLSVEAFRRKSPGMRVYTLGNELVTPFRLNPFELLPGVRVEAHLSKLQACIEGAIPPIGPSASIIGEALLRVYESSGWRLTDTYPLLGVMRRPFPMLSDFVRAVEDVLRDRKYEGEVKSNMQAALVGRFKPLLLGGKGRMFDTQRSAPSPAELFGSPVVLEMNDLNIDDKALVVMFLLTILREHREIERSKQGELKHVTLVEEAHNILEDVGSVGGGEGATTADTRFKAVQAFCSMLTEIRSLGEGLIIADQSPEKLARDAVRNTNVQIAHQLRDGRDRDAIANAMIMEDEQRDYLGKLAPGHAALFRTGLEKATFIQVEPYYPGATDLKNAPSPKDPSAFENWKRQFRGYGFNPLITDAEVGTHMIHLDPEMAKRRQLSNPFPECELCAKQCQYRDAMFVETGSPNALEESKRWVKLTDKNYRSKKGISIDDMWNLALDSCFRAIATSKLPRNMDVAWCHFVHFWDHSMRGGSRDRSDPVNHLREEERMALKLRFDKRVANLGRTQVRIIVWDGHRRLAMLELGAKPVTIGWGQSATIRIPREEGLPEIAAVLTNDSQGVVLESRRLGKQQHLPLGTKFTAGPLQIELMKEGSN